MRARVVALPPVTMAEPADTILLAACALGDRAALARLYERHHARIRRFVAPLRGGEDVEDLVQSTFLTAWEQARRFRGEATVLEWLLGIAAHQARRGRRGDLRRRVAMIRLSRLPPRRPPGPLDELTRAEVLARLEAALARLPAHLREVFVLCEIEELSGVEVARILGIPAGTAWRRLHQARARIRAALEEGR